MEALDGDGRDWVDAALSHWRQGDCVVGEHWFIYRIAPKAPITSGAVAAAAEEIDAAESEVRGFMIATQTCDIVRRCADRPFIEVCPLVEVDEAVIGEIGRMRRSSYAYVPGVAAELLVADLDRVMTVEKAVVAGWERLEGCSDDDQARRLALALARKRARVAFPDDFSRLASKLQKHMSSKHDKKSPVGRALRALREIRIRAAPAWDAEKIDITIIFMRDESEHSFEGQGWDECLEKWLELIPSDGRFNVDGVVLTLDDMTAREYVESDPLDLDYLSFR